MKLRSRRLLLLLAMLCCFANAVASPAQIFTSIASFNSSNGYSPASLTQGSDGNFYGLTNFGGPGDLCYSSCGTIFKLTPSGVLTTLYTFCSQPGCTDGELPSGLLVQASDGNFYGTTGSGGSLQCSAGTCGTFFKVTTSGALTTLHDFTGTDGVGPTGVVRSSDGNFYGATYGGGTSSICSEGEGCGTVFKIGTTGTLTTLYNFCSQPGCLDGLAPDAPPLQATGGNLYGTTAFGGRQGDGNIYKLSSTGSLTVLYSFCSQQNCVDGSLPTSSLIQATDGNFYGTTSMGGTGSFAQGGTIFRITPSGTLTVLYSFCNQIDCADGSDPVSSLIQATDGNFYGTTLNGGANLAGTIFKITPTGTLTTLYNFCSLSNCTDGSTPGVGLIQATNENFYGTTAEGGSSHNCTDGCGTVFSLSGPNPTPFQFIPLTPCREVDTRNTDGEFGGPPMQGNTSRSFPLPQNPDCGVPATAAAYSLNVTVVPRGALNYLTIWPTGEAQPLVSTMNSPDGRVKANAAIVPAGANEAVSVYVTDTTDVILDIDGYFTAPSSQTYQFYAVAPCRVVDTRAGSGFPQDLGPPSLQAQTPRVLPILSSSCLQGITNPLAYSFNVTVVPNPAGQPLGYLTVWPSNQTQPVVSTLNNPTATVVANAAIVPAAPDGDVDVYAYNSTDLIIDINGYFGAPGGQNALSLYPVAPCRVLDTRNNKGQPFMGEKTVNVVGSVCAPPSSAQAYVFNATVVPPGSMPYLTLWPDGQQQPVVSTLNAYDGFITSNMAIVPTTNGSIDAYAAALTHLIVDISGYFAP